MSKPEFIVRFYYYRKVKRFKILIIIGLLVSLIILGIIYLPSYFSLVYSNILSIGIKAYLVAAGTLLTLYFARQNVWIQDVTHKPQLAIGNIFFTDIKTKKQAKDTTVHIEIKNEGQRAAHITRIFFAAYNVALSSGCHDAFYSSSVGNSTPITISKAFTKLVLINPDTLYFIRIYYKDLSRYRFHQINFFFKIIRLQGKYTILTMSKGEMQTIIDKMYEGIPDFDLVLNKKTF